VLQAKRARVSRQGGGDGKAGTGSKNSKKIEQQLRRDDDGRQLACADRETAQCSVAGIARHTRAGFQKAWGAFEVLPPA
jgi:hypothetical protein